MSEVKDQTRTVLVDSADDANALHAAIKVVYTKTVDLAGEVSPLRLLVAAESRGMAKVVKIAAAAFISQGLDTAKASEVICLPESVFNSAACADLVESAKTTLDVAYGDLTAT